MAFASRTDVGGGVGAVPTRGITRAAAAALLLVASSAAATGCGGKAADGAGIGAPPFLAACGQTCADGLECLDGQCTLPCAASADCSTLGVNADCHRNASGERRCAVACSSDDGCMYLGAESQCRRAFCVAGTPQRLPDDFEALELHRLPAPSPGGFSPACDRSEPMIRLSVDLPARELAWFSCEPGNGAADQVSSSSSMALDDAAIALIRSAYARLRISRELRCDSEATTLTLDIQPAGGATQRYADAEHSSCPPPQRQTFVAGLNDLYALFMRVTGPVSR